MPVRALTCVALLLFLAACDARSGAVERGIPVISVPATAACADAPDLRQRATDVRLQVAEAPSQQTRTMLGARANFLASLAVVAQLQCDVALVDENQAFQAALDVARSAEETGGFYEQASRWNEANFALTGVIDALVQRRPLPAAD